MKLLSWLPRLLHPQWCKRIQTMHPATLQTAREIIELNWMKNNYLTEVTCFNSNLMSVIHRTILTPPIKVTRKLTLITKWCSWLSLSTNSRWINFLRRRLSNSKESPQSVDSFSPIRIYKISCQARVRSKGIQDLSLCHRRLSETNRSLRLWLPGRCSSKPSSSHSTY
jgi:hypothetical protein